MLIKPQALILTFVTFILFCQVHFSGVGKEAVGFYTNFPDVIAG